jgi:phage tail tape-measure protein
MLGGPPGITIGSIAGAVLGALVGAATVGVTGAKLGEVIDEKILDNYQCLACNCVFNQKLD